MDITWGVTAAANEVTWGSLIAIYLFLAGIAGGAFLTSSLTDLFNKTRPWKVIAAGAYIAPAAIIVGLGLLVVDLGRPFSFWKLLFNVNFGSVMSIGVFIISVFTVLALIYTYLVWQTAAAAKRVNITTAGREIAAGSGQSEGLRKAIAVLGALFGIGLTTYTGFLLSAVYTNNLWSTPFLGQTLPFLPVLFLVSGVSAGLAATLIGSRDFHDLKPYKILDIVLLVIEIILLFILYTSVKAVYFSGGMGTLFWLGVVVAGLLLPLVMAVYGVKSGKNLVIPVCSLVVVGGLCLRMFVVYAGQLFS